MRTSGKPRQLTHPVTNQLVYSPYPLTREEALRENVPKFWNPRDTCEKHPYANGMIYTFVVSGAKSCCIHEIAAAAYNHHVLELREPRDVTEAHSRGLDFYWSPEAHPRCGHVGKSTLAGKCHECETRKREASPRQLAMQQGETWYQPNADDPCPAGHVAPRRVNNGSCRQCEEDRGRGQRTEPIYRTNPDMIIARKDAIALGFTVYRTGKPCIAGHTGWRYTKTGGCIDCLRGNK